MKAFKIVLIVLAFIVLIIGGKLLLFPATILDTTIRTPAEVNRKIMNAENAIYNYEWFKQQEADIDRLYQQEKHHKSSLTDFVEILSVDRSEWTREDKQEWSRLRSNVTAQADMVNRAIQNYNAKSSMASRNIFKDNLPSNLRRSWFANKKLITN